MKAAERAERDATVLRLFVAGASYRQIAAAVGLRSHSQVHDIVQRELATEAKRRTLLTDDAFSVHQERVERLFQAHWGPALKGDYRSAEICRRLLDQNARLHGLYAEAAPSLPAPTPTASGGGDEQDDPQDELAQLRAARSGT